MTNALQSLFIVFALSMTYMTTLMAPSIAHGLGIKPPADTPRPPKATPSPTPAPTPKPTATPKPTPVATPKPTATPKPPTTPGGGDSTFKASWSGKNSNAASWTVYAQNAVTKYGDAMMKGATDVEDFCPMFDRLGSQDRVNFWVELVAAMAKFESSYDPTTRYTESTMGIDPITKKQVVSEGLLQLSYQDEQNYRNVLPAGVCDFDYASDKQYQLSDIRRSILDPKLNLTCGISILNRQLERYNKIAVSSGAYWSVIKSSSSHNRLKEIKAITNALSFCKR
jgi:hypothetical protein